jgi:hypothetical protein
MRHHAGAAVLVQERADEGSHVDCLFVPLEHSAASQHSAACCIALYTVQVGAYMTSI